MGKAVLSETPCHSRNGIVQKLKFYLIKIRSYTRSVFTSLNRHGDLMVERSPRMRKVGCSNPSRVRSKSLKQVVTAPLQYARQQV